MAASSSSRDKRHNWRATVVGIQDLTALGTFGPGLELVQDWCHKNSAQSVGVGRVGEPQQLYSGKQERQLYSENNQVSCRELPAWAGEGGSSKKKKKSLFLFCSFLTYNFLANH